MKDDGPCLAARNMPTLALLLLTQCGLPAVVPPIEAVAPAAEPTIPAGPPASIETPAPVDVDVPLAPSPSATDPVQRPLDRRSERRTVLRRRARLQLACGTYCVIPTTRWSSGRC
jgi:hypothetical protein